MIGPLASYVLPALFLASGVFAMAVLVRSWRKAWGELAGLRAQLDGTAETCDIAVRLATTQARPLVTTRRSAVRSRAVAGVRKSRGLRVAA